MKIEIDETLLFELMQRGQINAHQLQCLDKASKQKLRVFCLQLCKQEACHDCQWREHCQTNKSEQPVAIEFINPLTNRLN